MSDSDDDELPRQKVKKHLLCHRRQSSTQKNDYKGVKSYLDQFYGFAKDPHDKHTSEYHTKLRNVQLYSLWWRTVLTIGIVLIIGGLLAVLLAYVIPRKTILVEEEEDFAVLDKDAAQFNRVLEYVKLAGLATFCLGGMLSSLALLLASCCFRRCNSDSNRYYEDIEPSNVVRKLVDKGHENVPRSPMDKKVFGVQPGTSGGYPSAIPLINTEQPED